MCILFVAAWAANLHVFRAARIDIACIYPPKFLDGLGAGAGAGAGSSSSGGSGGGGRAAHHLLSSAGAGSGAGGSSSRSRSSSNASSGSSTAAAAGAAGAGAIAAGLYAGVAPLLLGGGPFPYPLCHPWRVARLVSALAAALLLCSLLMAHLLGQPYQHAPFAFYLLLLAALLYPLEATRPLRTFALLVGRVLWRVVFPRETEVLFLEVLVGDILTSLSKVGKQARRHPPFLPSVGVAKGEVWVKKGFFLIASYPPLVLQKPNQYTTGLPRDGPRLRRHPPRAVARRLRRRQPRRPPRALRHHALPVSLSVYTYIACVSLLLLLWGAA